MSRVLIVEDEAHLAKGLRFNLEAEGHSVEVAGDGERALTLLLKQAADFDAVVLDVMLPGKDGFTVASELRAAKQFRSGPHADRPRPPRRRAQRICLRRRRLSSQTIRTARSCWRVCEGLLRRREWTKDPATSSNWTAGDQPLLPSTETFSFDGRTIDFGKLELRANGNTIQLTLMEAELLRHLIATAERASPANQFWKKCGDCTKTPTLAPSITSSSACAATSRTIPPTPNIY